MTPVRILLVEDDPVTALALTGWLRHSGFDTVYATGPAEADAALARTTFDVVLSDVQMPGNHQLEWIERRLEAECPPPILLMSATPELQTTLRAANLPIAGYLLKPFDYARTAAQIERLAADHQHRRDLLALSHEVARLLEARTATGNSDRPDPFTVEMQHLARKLATQAARPPRANAASHDSTAWEAAIIETIGVLEKTKHSFRSKELGELRRRLLRLVPNTPPSASTRPVGAAAR